MQSFTVIRAKTISAPVKGRLNLVFSGIMAFVTRSKLSDRIPASYTEVLIPEVDMVAAQSKHAYKLGTWKPLMVRDIPAGRRYPSAYHLDGVRPGATPVYFDPTTNIYIKSPLKVHYRDIVRCSWVLPPPQSLSELWIINNVQPGWFTPSTDEATKNLKTLAKVHVFSYDFDDIALVRVLDDSDNVFWTPQIEAYLGEPEITINLHIFSEPLEWSDNAPVPYPFPFDALVRLTTDTSLGFTQPSVNEPDFTYLEPETEVHGLDTRDKTIFELPTLWNKFTGLTVNKVVRPLNCSPAVIQL